MSGNRNKKWLIIAGVIVAVVAVALGVYLLVSKSPVSAADYSQATTSAQEVADQYTAFNNAGQEYVTIAGKRGDAATLEAIDDRMQDALTQLKTSSETLSHAAALRDSEVKKAYSAYETKAQKFAVLADEYAISIPLYVSMQDTCSQIGAAIDVSNLLKELMLFAESAKAQSKADVLAVFDMKAGDCISAASKLKDSGTNTFAELGDLYFSTLTDTRKATEARFDETATLGAQKATANYQATNRTIENEAETQIGKIAEKQKQDAKDTDYTEEVKHLVSLLRVKASQ